MVTMGSSVIGREGSHGCKLIGWTGLSQRPPRTESATRETLLWKSFEDKYLTLV